MCVCVCTLVKINRETCTSYTWAYVPRDSSTETLLPLALSLFPFSPSLSLSPTGSLFAALYTRAFLNQVGDGDKDTTKASNNKKRQLYWFLPTHTHTDTETDRQADTRIDTYKTYLLRRCVCVCALLSIQASHNMCVCVCVLGGVHRTRSTLVSCAMLVLPIYFTHVLLLLLSRSLALPTTHLALFLCSLLTAIFHC